MKPRGYTLLETLMVLAIIAILFPALFLMIRSLYHSHEHTLARSIARNNGTAVLNDIVNDIRAASYSENGALPVVHIATNTITIYTDTDFDRKTEQIRYALLGDTLLRGNIEPTDDSLYPAATETTDVVLRRVQNSTTGTPVFRFYDEHGNEIDPTTGNTIAVKRIAVQLDVGGVFGSTHTHAHVHSSASIRNLKYIY
jgi:prepilin-type N-terminal cleavage/methylation domain-containing protein